MKYSLLLYALTGTLLLAGCAGTRSEFECNVTTSDTCMTMEQANEKAKQREEITTVKPGVAGLPPLAAGDFSSSTATPSLLTVKPQGTPTKSKPQAAPVAPQTVRLLTPPGEIATLSSARATASPRAGNDTQARPVRMGDRTGRLWIAPYIDSEDVYHQPGRVEFVIAPSHWGKPRLN